MPLSRHLRLAAIGLARLAGMVFAYAVFPVLLCGAVNGWMDLAKWDPDWPEEFPRAGVALIAAAAVSAVILAVLSAWKSAPGFLFRLDRTGWTIVLIIWALLVCWLFPFQTCPGHAPRGQLTRNGRNIVLYVISANVERESRGQGPVWPSPGRYGNSNEWFARLFREDLLECLSWSDLIMPGTKAAADLDELERRGVGWNVLAGAGTADDETPVLWTCNLRGIRPEDFAGADPAHPVSWSDRLDPEPFRGGSRFVVVARKGGWTEAIPARLLTDVAFLRGTTNDPALLQVLEAADQTPAEEGPDGW